MHYHQSRLPPPGNQGLKLLMRAVRKHTDCTWMLLYIERWLIAPAQLGDGTLVPRKKGTPQGRVISPRQPVAALRFDEWMRRTKPQNPFVRYAEDAVVLCQTESQARELSPFYALHQPRHCLSWLKAGT